MKKIVLSVVAFLARILPVSVKQGLYKVRPLANIIRFSLNSSAPQEISVMVIAAGGLSGASMLLDMKNEKNYWLGTYEPEMEAALAELVKPGMVAYDVGANIGYVSLLLAKAVGENGKVYSFEALPENAKRLSRNVELNEMQSRIFVQSMAVIDKLGEVQFKIHDKSDFMGKAVGSAGRQTETYSSQITVSGISLDVFVYTWKNPVPDVIKMDIEGGEVMALPGMKRLLAEAHPLMLMELHGPESARAAWEALTFSGYKICEMKPGFPEVPSLDKLDWKAYIVARHE